MQNAMVGVKVEMLHAASNNSFRFRTQYFRKIRVNAGKFL